MPRNTRDKRVVRQFDYSRLREALVTVKLEQFGISPEVSKL